MSRFIGGRGLGVGGRSVYIFAIYSLLTLLLTHPLLFNLTTAVPNDIGDPLLNTWILAWDSHALLTDPLNLFNANIFYPLPNTLAYSEHLLSTALLAIPLQLITAEPIAAYNLSLLAAFPLAAFGMYLLILRWTHCRSAAFIAGLIFAFAPYRFAAIAHLQLLTFQWLPLTLLSLDLYLKKGSGVRGQGSVLNQPPTPNPQPLLIFLLLQLLASWYLALYTLLTLGLYLLAAFFTRRLSRPAFLRLIFLFLISIFLTLPFAWPYFSLLDDLRAARPLSLALSLAAAPTDFAAAAPFNRIFGPLTGAMRTRPGFTEENTLFIGFVAPLLTLIAIVALISRPASYVWATPHTSRTTHHAPARSLPVGRTTFHPLPFIHNAQFTIHNLLPLLALLLLSLALTFPTPYAALAQLIPATTIIRVPPRWIIPALFALAALAGIGYACVAYQVSSVACQVSSVTHHVSRLTPHASRLVFFLTCALLLIEAFSVPLPLASVENRASLNPAYHWLAEQRGDLALIELPLHSAPAPEYPEVKRLYASTLGWWSLVNGYSGYTPPRQPILAQSLAGFPDPTAITALQNLTFQPFDFARDKHSNLPTFQPSNLPLFLLVHPGEAPFDRSRWETVDRWHAERNPALWPVGAFAGDYLYQVQPPAPTRFTTPPVATFGQDQTIRLLAYNLSIPGSEHSSLTSASRLTPHASRFTLYWQSTTSPSTNYTLFIHLRAADGFVRSQADGPPVSGHYPTSAWQPDEIIQDIHPLLETDLAQADHLAVGLYNPATGQRLPAFDAAGQRLADDALLISLDLK
ncbi:MAG: hypothetical protein L6R45_10540 [Anaerolineae bacterium]|nr:hypothetical protein [Anaerolineae bacterium]